MQKPITAIIVGAGHRALIYAELSLTNPELMKIVGVADPNPVRREMCMKKFGFSEDMCFETAEDLANAMEARGYVIGERRTSIDELRFKAKDYISFIVVLLLLALTIVLQVLG